MLKAIFFFQTYQNLFQYWFTLLHFALDDPVDLEFDPNLNAKEKSNSKTLKNVP